MVPLFLVPFFVMPMLTMAMPWTAGLSTVLATVLASGVPFFMVFGVGFGLVGRF